MTMPRSISYKSQQSGNMSFAARSAIEYLGKMEDDITRISLPDGVVWRRGTAQGATPMRNYEEEERNLLDAIADADERVKKAKKLINLSISAIVATLGLILFFAGVPLPGYMGVAGFWIFVVVLIAELIAGCIAVYMAMDDDKDGFSPWNAKKTAERSYRNWVAKRANDG